ncbi:maleylpyruvate isomerase family mycothiol-dependent enzyme [Mycobacterium sp. CVI_P3]|uniref:Maleylpyruvate isomerase family mycothiol-dependent enzyme n=1 Tax=Mycobacterium pinniadriaticum TaxID=2994102 RepID=A0ABT3SKX0_9MYCO|nr:maleylpyruvate isomerase family mycothiol-dependent enzyme [Mycobacterium pinniadriaticum]MCX2933595.1 maleylpyruvate isomerase family mycothiol-dependent enzyme [Mycobacterium pinniadriaticum]MCX2940017.1 maleylpyruvate isomerase family mycothiol-dependent enzyme [Mycobacterium pinniadriaticum]
MDSDEIWRNIDEQRGELADVLATLTPDQWTSASLCDGWQVRHVAAHLTQSQMSPARVVLEALKSGFRFDPMIRRLALEDTRPQPDIVTAMRDMVGSRRRIIGTSPLDPLTDMLVHGQDITVPLGIDRPPPVPAAVAAANHLWRMRFPMHPAKRVKGMRLIADDADFAVGTGYQITAPIRDILMVLAGRPADISGQVDAHRIA